jgi:phage terminase large subunit-like protein
VNAVLSPDDFDPEEFKRWTPEAQKQAADMLAAEMEVVRRAWFCKRGRSCDGKPHKGYEYGHARGDQWPPAGVDWFVWFLSAGSEYTRKISDIIPYIRIIAPTTDDVRAVCIEGESGLIAACDHAGVRGYTWEPSKHKFTFPNGAQVLTFSAEEPDRLRGKQSGFDWMDEPAHWPLVEDVWSNALYGLRLGKRIHVLCTTTPLPSKWVKKVVAEPDTIRVVAPTMANIDNLAPTFRKKIVDPLVGTRQGRQELLGEILSDIEGAMWMEQDIHRIEWADIGFDRVAIGIDPAGTANKRSDETGLVVAARKGDVYYVLWDGSARLSPEGWASRADHLYAKFQADVLVPEKNFGGDMVESTLRNLGNDAIRIKPVTARRGKALRAEPIVGMYEQGRVLHMPPPEHSLEDLETEMVEWVPGKGDSPNRVDALVHALTELADGSGGMGTIAAPPPVPMRGGHVSVLDPWGNPISVPSAS